MFRGLLLAEPATCEGTVRMSLAYVAVGEAGPEPPQPARSRATAVAAASVHDLIIVFSVEVVLESIFGV
jgi:hypothetical protein